MEFHFYHYEQCSFRRIGWKNNYCHLWTNEKMFIWLYFSLLPSVLRTYCIVYNVLYYHIHENKTMCFTANSWLCCPAEGLYWKRPIQCLASSEILTPHPTHRPASVYPPPFPPPLVRGEGTIAGWRGGGGSIVRKTPDTALYSIYAITLWPVPIRI